MRNFHFDPRDFQQFQNVAQTFAEHIGDIFKEAGKNTEVNVEHGKAQMRVDVAEDGQNVYVYAELPGVRKEDVSVTLNEDNTLTIKGEKKRPDTEGKDFSRVERGYGAFSRSFTIDEEVEQDRISAEFRDGVLMITLPKLVPVTKGFRVNIQ